MFFQRTITIALSPLEIKRMFGQHLYIRIPEIQLYYLFEPIGTYKGIILLCHRSRYRQMRHGVLLFFRKQIRQTLFSDAHADRNIVLSAHGGEKCQK